MDTTATPKTELYHHEEPNEYVDYEHQGYDKLSGGGIKDKGYARLQRIFSERVIPFNSRQVLIVQVTEIKYGKALDYTLVPGYIVSRKDDVSEVEPIASPEKRQELSDIVKPNIKGNLNFW